MESLEGTKISESHLVILLQLIYAGADVNVLLNKGLQYTQIAELIKEAIEKKLADETDEGLKITSLGLKKIKEGLENNRIKPKSDWISPLDEYKIEQLSVDAVYLPKKSTYYDLAELLASRGKPRE